MSAVNKLPLYKSLNGRSCPVLIRLPVQAGATQAIKQGEVCKLLSVDVGSSPVVPAAQHAVDFVPIIAWEEQKATDPARELTFALPTEGDLFEFALDTDTALKWGQNLCIEDSQTVKASESYVTGVAWVEPLADGSWQSVSRVFVQFCRVTASGLTRIPLMGMPATLTEYIAEITTNISDPGDGAAVPVTASGTINLTIAESAAETNALAIPTFAGQELAINAGTVGSGGTRVITSAQAVNQTGNTTLTFAASADFILLKAVKIGAALRWRVAVNDGVALGS
jgi:hypothetical protein